MFKWDGPWEVWEKKDVPWDMIYSYIIEIHSHGILSALSMGFPLGVVFDP
jgi:hypothetical protein